MKNITNPRIILIILTLCVAVTPWDYVNLTSDFCVTPTGMTTSFPTTGITSNGIIIVMAINTSTGTGTNIIFMPFYSNAFPAKFGTVDVDTNSKLYNHSPMVAADNNGGFVVIWNEQDLTGNYGGLNLVKARYFDTSFKGGSAIQINSTNGNPNQEDLNPSIIMLGTGNYLTLWNQDLQYASVQTIYGQQVTTSVAMTGTLTKLSGDVKVSAIGPKSASLGNGYFVATWSTYEYETTDRDIAAVIMKENGFTSIKAQWKVNTTNTVGKQTDPTVALLVNNQFIIVWSDENTSTQGDIMGQYYSLIGDPMGSNFKISTNWMGRFPKIKSLGADGFAVSYIAILENSQPYIAIQLFTLTGTKMGIERKIDHNTMVKTNYIHDMNFYINEQKLVFGYTGSAGTTNSMCFKLTYKDPGNCTDFTVNVTYTGFPLTFILNGSTGLVIRQLTSNGQIYNTSSKANVQIMQIQSNALIYNYSTFQDDYFLYNTNYADAPCKVTLTNKQSCDTAAGFYPATDAPYNCFNIDKPPKGYSLNQTSGKWELCYKLCETCTGYPSAPTTDMMCTTCKTGYYPKSDNTTSCYTGTISGYILNGSMYMIASSCYSTCQTCTGYPTNPNVSMYCKTCKTGYYPRFDNTSSCYQNPTGYFLDGSNVYQKCYDLCNSCTGYPTDPNTDMMCQTCLTGYYPKSDNTTRCFNGDIAGYALVGSIYQKCHKNCQACTDSSTPTDMKCSSCKSGLYPALDKTTSCFQDADMPGYYLDSGVMYKKCFETCKTCKEYPTDSTIDMKCDSCNTGSYPMVAKLTSCFKGAIAGYYLDKSGVLQKCHSACETCEEYPTDPTVDMKCKSCKPNSYPKVDNMSSCFQGDILGYTLVGSVYQKSSQCYSLCETCTSKATNPTKDMKCEKCISGYYPKIDNQSSCFKDTIELYYLDKSTDRPVYKNCYSLCNTCSQYPDDYTKDMSCTSCIKGYYPMAVEKPTSCFQGKIPQYYIDANGYQKCHQLCQTCSGYPEDATKTMLCDTCISGYYQKEDSPGSCFNDVTELYYLGSNMYKKCYNSCQICSDSGTPDDHKCTKCKPDYFTIEKGKSTNCYHKDVPPEGYYLNSNQFSQCFESCKTCNGRGDKTKPNCKECKANYSCEPCYDIIYQGQCITSCKEPLLYDDENQTCYECKDLNKVFYDSECKSDCPLGYVNKDFVCKSCESLGLLNQDGECITSCINKYLDNTNGYCVPCKVYI
jgi:hypothetical protein